MTILEQQGAAAKQAARKLAIAGTAKKNEALEAIARALEVGAPQWLAANAEDMKEAEANGMRPAMLDRLRLTEQRVADIVAAVRQVIALPDPVGRVTKMETRPNGLQIGRKTVPLGVIAIIYEARPNVTVDAAVLCFQCRHSGTQACQDLRQQSPIVLVDLQQGKAALRGNGQCQDPGDQFCSAAGSARYSCTCARAPSPAPRSPSGTASCRRPSGRPPPPSGRG